MWRKVGTENTIERKDERKDQRRGFEFFSASLPFPFLSFFSFLDFFDEDGSSESKFSSTLTSGTDFFSFGLRGVSLVIDPEG